MKSNPEDTRLQKSHEWRVPNWMNEKEYIYTAHDYPKPLINDQLRWEFVRRLQEYREQWEDYDFCRSAFNLIDPINPTIRGDELGSRSVLFIDSVMRGGMLSLAMPKQDKDFGEFILQLENDGFLILGFNPTLPEGPQIERAEKILKHYRDKIISVEDENEISYREIPIKHPSQLLRTLDAHNEGADGLEIGEIIYGLASNHAEGKAHARAVGHERLKEALSCWKRVIPAKDNVLL
jgi:hypothetical protein